MREKLATRQRGVSHDRDASIAALYILLAFALDFVLFRSQHHTQDFPWLLSQALGLALIVTLGIRFWFVLFLSIFANGYFIWHEGRSVTSMFLGIIMTTTYCLAAYLWYKIRDSRQNTFVKSVLFAGLSLATCGIVARLAWSILTRYELIDPIPPGIWASQLALRDTVDFLASFPFFAFLFVPFVDHLVYRGTGREKHRLEIHDVAFALLPFLALALPSPPDSFAAYQYLLFLPAIFVVYFYRVRGALALTFAVHLWLFKSWPFPEGTLVDPAIPFQIVFMIACTGAAYLFEQFQNEMRHQFTRKMKSSNSRTTKLWSWKKTDANGVPSHRRWNVWSSAAPRIFARP